MATTVCFRPYRQRYLPLPHHSSSTHHPSTDHRLQLPFKGRLGQMVHPLIDTLDDDSLLNIFQLYRPVLSDEEDGDEDSTKDGSILRGGDWVRERWWYGLVHVCRRWRYLILSSSSFLGVCLVCTRGALVATMLAHAPPVPLIIDHLDEYYDTTTEEEKNLLLALQHRDRVRRIRLVMPVVTLQKLIKALDGEFPILEYLYVGSPSDTPVSRPIHDMPLTISETLQAPHLRHLISIDFALPIGSPLMATSAGLVTLSLPVVHTYHDFCLNDFLERISHMPQLETLLLNFQSSVPNSDVEGQLSHMPVASHVALPNLRWFGFKGASAYLEALLPRVTAPLLEKLRLRFFDEPTFSLPHLLRFISESKNLKCGSAKLSFLEWGVLMRVYPHEEAKMYAFQMSLSSTFLSRQISGAAQICNALRMAFSSVEDLTLEFRRSITLFELTNGTDRAQCRELLRSFGNVKTLRVPSDLVGKVARSLRPEGEESPIELLPVLKELACPLNNVVRVAFAPFINARQSAGHPVILACIRYTIY